MHMHTHRHTETREGKGAILELLSISTISADMAGTQINFSNTTSLFKIPLYI